MTKRHWIGVGILFVALILALQNPVGAGHLLTQVLQGIDSVFANIKKA